MRQKRSRFVAHSLLAGLILSASSFFGFFLLRSRPGLPDGIQARDVVRIDDTEIRKPKDIEFVLTQKKIGDWASFALRSDGSLESLRAQFIAFYSRVPFPLIYLFIGLACYLIGFTVFILRWEDPGSRLLYWLALIFAFPLIVSGGTYILGHGGFAYVPVVLFYLFYPLTPAFLFHFSLSFSSPKRRRPESAEVEEFSFGDATLHFKKRTARKGKKALRLTTKEFGLLRLLISREGEVISRNTILNEVWGYEKFPTTRTVDTFIHNLRRKLENNPSRPRHLLTVPWSGYKFQR